MSTPETIVKVSHPETRIKVQGTGPPGPTGAGVPIGGTAGQPLVKVDGTNFNTAWSALAAFKSWLALTLSDIAAALGFTPPPNTRSIATTAPLTGGGDLSANRTIAISDFVASGASHARGAVPDPGASAGTAKFLCENASWAALASIATSGSATDLAAGTVPAARMPALTGDVTTTAGAVATTLAANVVTNAKAAQMAANTVKMNNTGSLANAIDATLAQFKAWLALTLSDITTALGFTPQPLDSDLTAIAALSTTSYGRSLLTLAAASNLAAQVVGGTDTQVQFNDGGVLGGERALAWDKATKTLTVGEDGGFGWIQGGSNPAGPGGFLVLKGGSSTAIGEKGGDSYLYGGTPVDGDGGWAILLGSPGVGINRAGGDFRAQGGYSTGSATGGGVVIDGGPSADTGDAGPVIIRGGPAIGSAGKGGNVSLAGGTPAGSDPAGAVDVSPELRLKTNLNDGNYVGLKAPAGLVANTVWRLPVADGTAGQALVTNGTAVLSFSAVQPLDADLTAIAALSTTSFGRGLLALADAAAGRTAFGLGTASIHAHGDYDAAGAAAAAQAASQPLDSDLTAIAALTTTSYGRSLLEAANAAALRTLAGTVIGTDVQAQDAELAAIAALTSAANKLAYFTGAGTAALADFTAAGRALVDDADATAQRNTLALGTSDTVRFENLGLGVAPTYKLQVDGGDLAVRNDSSQAQIFIGRDATYNTYPGIWFANNVAGHAATNYTFLYDSTTKGSVVNSPSGGYVHFRIGNDSTDALLLDANKRLMVGGAYNSSSVGKLYVRNFEAATIVAVFRGFTSQSADILQCRNVSDTVLTKVDKDGYLTLPGGLRLLGYVTSVLAPTTSDLPNSKDCAIHKDTALGTVRLAFNDGGTIRSVILA